MIKAYLLGAIAAAFLFTGQNHELCQGIFPKNDLNIPASEVSALTLSEIEFNEVLDRIDRVFKPIITKKGGTLVLRRLWENGTVNASAQQFGSRYIVNMYGGLARYGSVTPEAFALVACHEVGHHLGAAPKVSSWFNSWASNEGQSDYFSGMKCFRRIYTDQENMEWVANNEVHPVVADKCSRTWPAQNDQAFCMRFAHAGRAITQMFKELQYPDKP